MRGWLAYLVFLMAAMAVSGEQASGSSTTAVPVTRKSEAPAETEDGAVGNGSEEDSTEIRDRHHSWAQATADEAISPAITDWRFVLNSTAKTFRKFQILVNFICCHRIWFLLTDSPSM